MIHFHQRFLVAVTVEKNFYGEVGKTIVGCVFLQKLTKKECLLSEPGGALAGGKKIVQLIAKHRSTTGLQDDDWQACVNLRAKRAHNFA